jgi:hypothetical protein
MRAFKLYVLEVALIAAGLCLVAPSTSGRVAGVLFALALLPVPPLAIHAIRTHRDAR